MNQITQFINQSQKLLIIVAEIPFNDVQIIKRFLIKCHCSMIIEPLSQLRTDLDLQLKIVSEMSIHITDFTHVLRIGGIPVTSLWRQLANYSSIQTLSISHLPFNGLTHGQLINDDYHLLMGSCQQSLPDLNGRQKLADTFPQHSNSEAEMIHQLSCDIPSDSRIYLGNSSPIRMWANYATYENSLFQIYASRGVNGIDGQISTFLGICGQKSENWGIFGDLTALYDLSSLWILPQLRQLTIRIVIIHNYGGQIFAKKFPKFPDLINQHTIEFDYWAKLWGIQITTITDMTTFNHFCWDQHHIIILKPQK